MGSVYVFNGTLTQPTKLLLNGQAVGFVVWPQSRSTNPPYLLRGNQVARSDSQQAGDFWNGMTNRIIIQTSSHSQSQQNLLPIPAETGNPDLCLYLFFNIMLLLDPSNGHVLETEPLDWGL